jgi:uncharacterized protein YcbX
MTPVKSFRLHHPDELWLGPRGAAEDRRFLLVDEGGRLYSGNRDAVLVRGEASWDPDSRRLRMSVPGAGTLEHEVVRGASTVVDVYGRRVRGHVVAGPWAAALSKSLGRTLTLIERDDGAWATDIRPVTMVSQGSLNLVGGDGRRFRMLLEVDGVDALEEESWCNRRARIGNATLLVGSPTPRCGFPSADPDTGSRDRDMLRELIDIRGLDDGGARLGVYAEVLEPGLVRVGDELELASARNRSTMHVIDRLRVSSRQLKLRPRTAG